MIAYGSTEDGIEVWTAPQTSSMASESLCETSESQPIEFDNAFQGSNVPSTHTLPPARSDARTTDRSCIMHKS